MAEDHSAQLRRDVSLEDKYTQNASRAYMTGIEALVRLLLIQRQRDAEAGLNTAGFVSGYRGSPLGTLDQSLWQAKKHLDEHRIHFQPGVNEDLAATSVWGTQQVHLLGAPYRGGGEVFVDPGLEMDTVFVEVLFGLPQRLVQGAERGATVAGDEAGGVEPGLGVALTLDQQQSYQGLDPGHVGPGGILGVLVLEGNVPSELRGVIFGHGTYDTGWTANLDTVFDPEIPLKRGC